ncbi:Sperm-tail PG-rich repeat-containing protein 2 [Gonapodya sp. JEL0774]|nr:Sperm-tail PG-rich repeat-containing protein 2 [Gonapodya sp. JEL0774]
MYSRAPRDLFHVDGNADLGPGTYAKSQDPKRGQSYAPFSSIAPRVSIFDSLVGQSPAPTSYESKFQSLSSHVHTDAPSFGRSKIERFRPVTSDSPGPTVYGLVSAGDSVTNCISDVSESPRIVARGRGQSVSKTDDSDDKHQPTPQLQPVRRAQSRLGSKLKPRIVWKRKFLPPSIPFRETANGYQEAETGELLPRRLSTQNVVQKPCEEQTPTKLRGISFGAPKPYSPSSNDRMSWFKPTEGVPPTTYDVQHAVDYLTSKSLDAAAEGSSSAAFPLGNGVRWCDKIVMDAEKDAIPGPGEYDDAVVTRSAFGNLKRASPEFRSKVGRFSRVFGFTNSHKDPELAKTPGPGAYNVLGRRRASLSHSSLGQRKDSVLYVRTAPPTPGPGTLANRTSNRHSLFDKPRPVSQPFGGTSKRFVTLEEVKKRTGPGPGAYDVLVGSFRPDRRGTPKKVHSHGAFGAISERFSRPSTSDQTPGPAEYATVPTQSPRSNEDPRPNILITHTNRQGHPVRQTDAQLLVRLLRGAVMSDDEKRRVMRLVVGSVSEKGASHFDIDAATNLLSGMIGVSEAGNLGFGTSGKRFEDLVDESFPTPASYDVDGSFKNIKDRGKLSGHGVLNSNDRRDLLEGEWVVPLLPSAIVVESVTEHLTTTYQDLHVYFHSNTPAPGSYEPNVDSSLPTENNAPFLSTVSPRGVRTNKNKNIHLAVLKG